MNSISLKAELTFDPQKRGDAARTDELVGKLEKFLTEHGFEQVELTSKIVNRRD